MKKLLLYFFTSFFCLIFFIEKIFTEDDTTGKSFFWVRSLFTPISPEIISIRRDELRITDCENKFGIDIIPFGGSSFNEKGLTKYFLPSGKTELLAGELGSNAVKENTVDIIANYFGVLTAPMFQFNTPVGNSLNNYTFESKLKFEPKQQFYGATILYKQHLSRFTDKGFWFDVVIPIQHVQNDMGLKEEVIKPGGPNGDNPNVPKNFFVANMKQAFKQNRWRFGKINGPRSATGVADVFLRIGYLSSKEENYYLNSFIGFGAPTGTDITAEFVFEPVLGQNKHASFFAGISAGFRIWGDCEKTLYLTLDSNGTIFFANNQLRSFDLKGKPWSRYMWLYLDSTATVTSPGINTFTKHLTVTPGTARDLNTTLTYKDKCSGLQGEVGYHFFSRQCEDVKLAQKWEKGPAIAAIIKNGEFIGGGTSRNNATINQYLGISNDTINGTEVYNEIEESDIDLNSAAHPTVISHTFYLTLSKNWDNIEYPKFLGAGASIEFSTDNVALDRWLLWARFGISF